MKVTLATCESNLTLFSRAVNSFGHSSRTLLKQDTTSPQSWPEVPIDKTKVLRLKIPGPVTLKYQYQTVLFPCRRCLLYLKHVSFSWEGAGDVALITLESKALKGASVVQLCTFNYSFFLKGVIYIHVTKWKMYTKRYKRCTLNGTTLTTREKVQFDAFISFYKSSSESHLALELRRESSF